MKIKVEPGWEDDDEVLFEKTFADDESISDVWKVIAEKYAKTDDLKKLKGYKLTYKKKNLTLKPDEDDKKLSEV